MSRKKNGLWTYTLGQQHIIIILISYNNKTYIDIYMVDFMFMEGSRLILERNIAHR